MRRWEAPACLRAMEFRLCVGQARAWPVAGAHQARHAASRAHSSIRYIFSRRPISHRRLPWISGTLLNCVTTSCQPAALETQPDCTVKHCLVQHTIKTDALTVLLRTLERYLVFRITVNGHAENGADFRLYLPNAVRPCHSDTARHQFIVLTISTTNRGRQDTSRGNACESPIPATTY